jgi:hypothetical protein
MPPGQEVSVRVLRSRRIFAAALLASVVLAAGVEIASTDPAERRAERGVSRNASPHEANLRVVRSWRDTVKIGGRDESRTVEIVFDSDAGVARRRIFPPGSRTRNPLAQSARRARRRIPAPRSRGRVVWAPLSMCSSIHALGVSLGPAPALGDRPETGADRSPQPAGGS